MSEPVTGHVVVRHETGLHARPSVKLTKLAKGFSSSIEIARAADGPWIDAKSIVKVMALKLPQHETLYLRANGADAFKAVADLIALVERDFDDA